MTNPPPVPSWQQPTAPQPAAKRRRINKGVLLSTAGVMVLCCGGFLAIGIFADDPDSESGKASVAVTTAAAPAPLLAQPAATSPSAAPAATLASPSPSAVETARRQQRRVAPSTRPTTAAAKPKPKPKPRPSRTTSRPKPAPKLTSFANCTALRKVYPAGVPEGHPAYASKHDRDKDGWACETT